jgi:hypothetical protein
MKKIENYDDFYDWTIENELDYKFDTKKDFNDTIVVYNQYDHDNWVSVPYPAGEKGSWDEIKKIIEKALL